MGPHPEGHTPLAPCADPPCIGYQELSLEAVNTTRNEYFYPCCPGEPWPAIKWNFILSRASSYYIQFYMWPAILVTFLSFGAFFMSPDVGERLGYGITLVLTVEVGKAIFHEMLPVCGEMLWIVRHATLPQALSLRAALGRSAASHPRSSLRAATGAVQHDRPRLLLHLPHREHRRPLPAPRRGRLPPAGLARRYPKILVSSVGSKAVGSKAPPACSRAKASADGGATRVPCSLLAGDA